MFRPTAKEQLKLFQNKHENFTGEIEFDTIRYIYISNMKKALSQQLLSSTEINAPPYGWNIDSCSDTTWPADTHISTGLESLLDCLSYSNKY